MSGYRWDPVVRVVPVNGAESVFWFTDRLTDLGSHTRINLRYVEQLTSREDINRTLRPIVYGLRPEVDIECVIYSMADHQFLADIESALLDTQFNDVFLSLDGGVTERRVVLGGVADPQPLAGKTIIGARFTLRFRCADLIARRPAMMTDPDLGAEFLPDGSIEDWTAGQPTKWSGTGGIITVAQESTIKIDGSYSAKVTRSDGSTFGQFYTPSGIPALSTGRWYRYRCRARASLADMPNSLRVQIFNVTRNLFVASDGKTWDVTGDLISTACPFSPGWPTQQAYFRIPTGWSSSDLIVLRHSGYWTASESIYYDALSIYGPALRTGYATW